MGERGHTTDSMTRALLYGGRVSITAVQSTRLVQRAVTLHGPSPVCAAALGRTMTVTAVLASELKNERDRLTVTVKGGGPIGSVVVSCDRRLCVRGSVTHPDLDLPLNPDGKLDVGAAVGREGTLTVVKDLGLKEPYIGQCALSTGEIGEDFARYFLESEQQPSAVAVGVLAGPPSPSALRRAEGNPGAVRPLCRCLSAGGFLIRVLPLCPEETVCALEEKLASLGPVSALMRGKSSGEFLKEFFSDCGLEILEELTPRYRCKCSRRSVERLLHTLKYEELKQYIREDGIRDIHCQFCNKHYPFYDEDIDRIFLKKE